MKRAGLLPDRARIGTARVVRAARRYRRQAFSWGFALILCLVGAGFTAKPVVGVEPVDREAPITFEADWVTHNNETGVTEAVGNVEVRQNERTLRSQRLVYEETTQRVTATGNVRLIEPTGEVIDATSMELTGDFKEGVIEDLRAVLRDGSRLTARSATRTEGNRTVMNRAGYTACFACPENPAAPPIWQIKAVRVIHDQAAKSIEFEDATLEFGGVPVAYLPYFWQPDPTVKRKTGFLIPTLGASSGLGFLVKVPFFWALSPDQDITLTPWMTSKQGPVLEAQFRRALRDGEIRTEGSITRDSDDRTGAHVFSKMRYDIDEDWRAGFDAARTSYRTYLRRYGLGNERTLESRLFAEQFDRRNFFAANAYSFQNLDQDSEQKQVPFVAPQIDYFYAREQDSLGGWTDIRLNALNLVRRETTDTRRLSGRGRWQLPMVGPLGNLFTVTAALWGDGYYVNQLDVSESQPDYQGTNGRLFPTASVGWSLPLIRDGETMQQVIEPKAEVVAAPNYGNKNKIPNEDSQEFEIQDTNVFGLNPFPGIDRVFEGPRVNYGVEWSAYGSDGGGASVFAGQTYQFTNANEFPSGSGYENKLSDFVSAVELTPGRFVSAFYRNRLDNSDFSIKRNELGATIGATPIRLATSFVRYDDQQQQGLTAADTTTLDGRREINGDLTARLSRYWSTRLIGIRDLKADSFREIGARVIYEDECFLLQTGYRRQNIKDRNLDPKNTVFLRVGLKTIGEARTDYTP